MQDIMDKLQHILSTKEGQEQLKNISSMLNNNANTSDNNNNNNNNSANANENINNNQSNQNNQSNGTQGGFDMSAITSMLSGLQGGSGVANPLADTLSSFINNSSSNNNNSSSNNTQEGFPNIDMNMIMGIQKAFSAMNVNDKNTQLLIALKPHFSPERSKKVDQALGLMRLMTALPTLKESGILSGIL